MLLIAFRNLILNFCQVFVALISLASCFAQGVSLGLTSGSAAPGGTVTLDLSLSDPLPDPAAAVEWTLSYSSTDFSSATISASPAVSGVNKGIACNNVAGAPTCVLWGENATSISSGVVASVSLSVSPTTKNTSSLIQVNSGMAADGGGLSLSTSSSGATVTIAQPPGLNGFSCNSLSLTPPTTALCTAYLTSPALAGGASVSLVATPADVIVPAGVSIPPGATSATVTATPTVIGSAETVTIAASYLGTTPTLDLSANPSPAPISTLSASPNAIAGDASGVGTVSLVGPAGASGVLVSLTSSNPAAATIPANVVVAPGADLATFPITGGAVSAATCVSLTAAYGAGGRAATLIVQPRQSQSGAACFTGLDTNSQGNWQGVYGTSGSVVIGDSSAGPATFTPSEEGLRSWATTTTDTRALQRASGGRIADMWYSPASFLVSVGLQDAAVHQLSIYCLDWNLHNRTETINILDSTTNDVLDTQTISNFTNGVYARWNISGAVTVQITRIQGNNAVISGLFID